MALILILDFGFWILDFEKGISFWNSGGYRFENH